MHALTLSCQRLRLDVSTEAGIPSLILYNRLSTHKGYIDGATTRLCIPAKKRAIRVTQLMVKKGWFHSDEKKETCRTMGTKQHKSFQLETKLSLLQIVFIVEVQKLNCVPWELWISNSSQSVCASNLKSIICWTPEIWHEVHLVCLKVSSVHFWDRKRQLQTKMTHTRNTLCAMWGCWDARQGDMQINVHLEKMSMGTNHNQDQLNIYCSKKTKQQDKWRQEKEAALWQHESDLPIMWVNMGVMVVPHLFLITPEVVLWANKASRQSLHTIYILF